MQHRAVTARFLEYPPSERNDQPRLLGERDELERRDRSLRRMLPTEQCLVARYLVRPEIDHRLVVERELAELDGLA